MCLENFNESIAYCAKDDKRKRGAVDYGAGDGWWRKKT